MRSTVVSLHKMLLCVALLSAAGLTRNVSAEFIKTNPGVYQSTGKHTKVIVSQQEPGIFIVYGPEIDLQIFDPLDLKKSDAQHLFVRFDPSLNRYSAIVIGKKEYKIATGGSFTVNCGPLRVTVDNANPYLTVVNETSVPEPEILGVMGLNVVVNNMGQKAVALLEANQLARLSGVFDPYQLKEGLLYVKGRQVGNSALGISIEEKHACLESDSLIIPREELDKINDPKVSKEESRKKLGQLIEAARKLSPLKGLLRLRTSKEMIIALNPLRAEVLLVKEATVNTGGRTLCSIEKVRFK